MKWLQSYSVGNTSIDAQHAKLFECVDDFIAACNQKKGSEEIIKTLDFLAKYTVEHFKDEENYMMQNGYPGIVEHKKIHQDFVKFVTDFITDTKKSEINISSLISMNIKLNDWLLNHIMKEDTQYGKYIQSKK